MRHTYPTHQPQSLHKRIYTHRRKTQLTKSLPILRITLSKDPRLVRLLIAQVVPLVSRPNMQLLILDHVVWVDEVGGFEVGGRHAADVAEGEGPVAHGAYDWFPDTVVRECGGDGK